MSGACWSCAAELPHVDGRSKRRRYCSEDCRNAVRRASYQPKPRKPGLPLAERLWARCVRQPNGCLEWQGFRSQGYGQIGRGGGRANGLTSTHRAAWEVTYGPIPDGMFVCHRCDNPPCCEPEHLFLGALADNVADMVAKGRQARGERLPHTKLSDAQVVEIRTRYRRACGPTKRGGRSSNATELAEEFGISRIYVSQLVHGHFRKGVAA